MTFEEIEKKVIEWASDRAILASSNSDHQIEKLYEEFIELECAISKYDYANTIDSIGDMLVVLTLISFFSNVDLKHCYETAYNQIKDRRGKMVDGLFVKES
jgi:NTP pyrophosphatase (non-canonical NTP hydrolase)